MHCLCDFVTSFSIQNSTQTCKIRVHRACGIVLSVKGFLSSVLYLCLSIKECRVNSVRQSFPCQEDDTDSQNRDTAKDREKQQQTSVFLAQKD